MILFYPIKLPSHSRNIANPFLKECIMNLFVWLRKISGMQARGGNRPRRNRPAQRSATTRPCLEPLEDRLTPSTFDTVTNAFIWTNPSNSERGIERITAVVTQAGTGAPVTNGNVVFSVNGNAIATVPLNSSGYAQIDIAQTPSALSSTQTVQASYQGATVGADTINASAFSSNVYLNMWNAMSTSFISFAGPAGSGDIENDDCLFFNSPSPTGQPFLLVQYVDPGMIAAVMGF
jgi:hypothetical protein